MKKKSKLDLTDFYYCAEQIFVSLVTSFFENPDRSEWAKEEGEGSSPLRQPPCTPQKGHSLKVIVLLIMIIKTSTCTPDTAAAQLCLSSHNTSTLLTFYKRQGKTTWYFWHLNLESQEDMEISKDASISLENLQSPPPPAVWLICNKCVSLCVSVWKYHHQS